MVTPIGEHITFGRGQAPARDRVHFDDPEVSRQHAQVIPIDDAFEVRDLGSRNGTWTDARAVSNVALAHDGALVFLGGQVLTLRFVPPQALDALDDDEHKPLLATPTRSPTLALVHAQLRRLAHDHDPVFLVGPHGSGRTSYARRLHDVGQPGRPFVRVEAAELARGKDDLAALVTRARGGSLHIDDLEHMPSAARGEVVSWLRKTLPRAPRCPRFILTSGDDRSLDAPDRAFVLEVRRACGGTDAVVTLPALCRRKEDLPALIADALGPEAQGEARAQFATCAWRALFLYDWPGNLTELRACVQGLATRAQGPNLPVAIDDLPLPLRLQCGQAQRRHAARPAESSATLDGHADDAPSATSRTRSLVTLGPTLPAASQVTSRAAAHAATVAAAVDEVAADCGWSEQQVAIVRHFVWGLSHKEIAARLGIARQTVTEQLHRAARKAACGHPDALAQVVLRRFEGRSRAT